MVMDQDRPADGRGSGPSGSAKPTSPMRLPGNCWTPEWASSRPTATAAV